MSKHTPGEWRIDLHSAHDKMIPIAGRGPGQIAFVDQDDIDTDEAAANAALIAAAPDLLAALEDIVRHGHARGYLILERARAAIRKAKGGAR